MDEGWRERERERERERGREGGRQMQQPKASPTRPTMHEGSITHSLPKGWREGERERERGTAILHC